VRLRAVADDDDLEVAVRAVERGRQRAVEQQLDRTVGRDPHGHERIARGIRGGRALEAVLGDPVAHRVVDGLGPAGVRHHQRRRPPQRPWLQSERRDQLGAARHHSRARGHEVGVVLQEQHLGEVALFGDVLARERDDLADRLDRGVGLARVEHQAGVAVQRRPCDVRRQCRQPAQRISPVGRDRDDPAGGCLQGPGAHAGHATRRSGDQPRRT
jgi:hypothetical protein